jgi:hypothetical protein
MKLFVFKSFFALQIYFKHYLHSIEDEHDKNEVFLVSVSGKIKEAGSFSPPISSLRPRSISGHENST